MNSVLFRVELEVFIVFIAGYDFQNNIGYELVFNKGVYQVIAYF